MFLSLSMLRGGRGGVTGAESVATGLEAGTSDETDRRSRQKGRVKKKKSRKGEDEEAFLSRKQTAGLLAAR